MKKILDSKKNVSIEKLTGSSGVQFVGTCAPKNLKMKQSGGYCMNLITYDIYLGSEKINVVFYEANYKMSAEDVRQSLISIDHFSSAIHVIRRAEGK